MEVTLVGYRPVDFTDRNTNNRIKGTTLYLVGKTDSNISGMEAWRAFTSETLELTVGGKYEIQYNKSGNIASISKK